MKEFKHAILTFAGILLILLAERILEQKISQGGLYAISGVVAVLSLALIYFLLPFITSRFYQYVMSGIDGVWGIKYFRDRELISKIKKSTNIKIKVTHGGIFLAENDIFHRCIIKNEFKLPTVTEIEILLNFPCKNSDHLEKRAKNIYKVPENKYLGEIYDVLRLLLKAKVDNSFTNISIRLYGDQQIKWRYYLFTDDKQNKTLYLGFYQQKKKGKDISMLKINGGEKRKTVCDEFEEEFDNIFKNKAFDIDELFNSSDLHERKVKLECMKDDIMCSQCHEAFKNKIKNVRDFYNLAANEKV